MSQLAFDPAYNRDLAQLFSAPVALAFARGRAVPLIRTLVRRAITGLSRRSTFAELYEAVYGYLWDNYRAEYLYKNTIASRILLGRHSVATTRMFCEFRAELAKADVVLVNGTTTAYEIKTELDSLDRLPSQLAAYCRIFDRVFVVTHRSVVRRVLACAPDCAGVLELTDRGSLRVARAAVPNRERLVPGAIFDSLRRDEYLQIIAEKFGYVPDVPNTEIYTACRHLFERLSPGEAHDAFANALRGRTLPPTTAALVEQIPPALAALCLSANFTPSDARAFAERLSRSPLGTT